jgi:hypothetical protein
MIAATRCKAREAQNPAYRLARLFSISYREQVEILSEMSSYLFQATSVVDESPLSEGQQVEFEVESCETGIHAVSVHSLSGSL